MQDNRNGRGWSADAGEWVEDRFRDFQNGPRIGHPGVIDGMIPIYGSGRDALAYLQEGDYGQAALSAGELALDAATLVPAGFVARSAGAAMRKGVRVANLRPTYNQAYRDLRKAKIHPGKGYEAHHMLQLYGKDRSARDFRNHPAFLKVLTQAEHDIAHAPWKWDNALLKINYGTPEWVKAAAVAAAGAAPGTSPED
jgi:hypothetical protein